MNNATPRKLTKIEMASLRNLLADQDALWERAFQARATCPDLASFEANQADMASLDASRAKVRAALATGYWG